MKERNRRDFIRCCGAISAGAAVGAVGLSGCNEDQSKCINIADSGIDFSRISYCCINCDNCPLYKATLNNDDKLKMKMAEEWGGTKEPGFKLEDYYCYGCKDKRSCGRPGRDCTIIKCATKKGFAVCAQCSDFEECDEKIWSNYPGTRDRVRKIKAKLGLA